MNRRYLPPQEYGPLFSAEQVAAIRAARERAKANAERLNVERRNTVTVHHKDSNGDLWRFGIHGNRTQRKVFENLLAVVRNVGHREALALSWYDQPDENAEFCRGLETTVLTALSNLYPPPPQPLPEVEPLTVKQEHEHRGNTEETTVFWWNND